MKIKSFLYRGASVSPMIILGYIILIIFASSCTQRLFMVDSQKRLEILEGRVFQLENERQRSLKELREVSAEFKVDIVKKIENFQKSQQFFLKELDQLKEDMEQITREYEETKKISRVSKNQLILLRKKLGDQTIALNELSGYFKSEIQYNEVPESPEKKLFNQAFDFFKKKETQKALFDFALFRQQYPKSDLIDDALYFTGYIHFISERYEQASLRFFELMERYPDSNRIRETTWWLGVTQERSGDLGGALDLYKKLLLLKKTDSFRISAESRIEELESSLELKEKGRR